MYSGPATGLWSSPNSFSAVPAGSLATADNVVFAAPSVIEPRRGFAEMVGARFGTTGSLADAISFNSFGIFVAFDELRVAFSGSPLDGFVSFTNNYVPNGTHRMRFEEAARSTFFNPDAGIRMYDASGEPSLAGCPLGLNISAVNAPDDGWMLPDTAVAYRFTICRKGAFGRIVEGPPSGRTVLRNIMTVLPGYLVHSGGGSQIVTATAVNGAQTPHNLQPGDEVTLAPGEAFFAAGTFIVATTPTPYVFTYDDGVPQASSHFNAVTQVFSATRSATLTCYLPILTTDAVSAANFVRLYRSEMTLAATDTPGDELFQCYETAYLSATELSNGYVTITDVAPESTLEIPLYTNANTGDGTLAANFQPPIAEDLFYWQNRMWYLNTTAKHAADLTLIGTGSPDGLQDGDTITIFPDDLAQVTLTLTARTTPVTPAEFEVFEDGDPGFNIQRTAQALCQCINQSTNTPVYAFYVSSETGTPGQIHLEALEFKSFAGTGSFSVYSSRPTPWTPQLPTFVAPAFAALASTNNRHAARLWYSKLGQPEAVPLTNYEQIDADNAPALRCIGLNYRLLIFKTDGVYFVPNTFPPALQKLSDHICIAPDSVQRLGDAVYFLSDQGLMMVDDSGVRSVSIPIDSTLNDLMEPTSLPSLGARTVAIPYRSARMFMLWTLERDDLDAMSTDNAQAFVYSTLVGGFTRFPFGIRCGGICPNQAWGGNDQLIVAPTDDNVLWLERKSLTDADYLDVDDVPIDCEVTFNSLTDGAPASMKMAQQCSFLWKANGLNSIDAVFSSELHPSEVIVPMETAGWGSFPWGEEPWGGFVRAIRRIQPLPVQVGNCCQLSVGFRATCDAVKFSFLGIDVSSKPDTASNRG